jgi:hypothetical protein
LYAKVKRGGDGKTAISFIPSGTNPGFLVMAKDAENIRVSPMLESNGLPIDA